MTPLPEPRIAVIGPGAIGTTVAALLHDAGRTPFIAGRSARAELRLRSERGTVAVPGPVATDAGGVQPMSDLVFLAVKATQTAAAGDWLAALCGPGTVVCVLQNGVEQREQVAPLVPAGEVVPAVVWFPAVREADDAVRLLADPRLTVPDTPGGATVENALRGTRCRVEISNDFPTVAWRKLLQNAAAGLMAVTGRRSGMFARDDIGDLTLDYLAECLVIARADGARLDDDEPQRILESFRASPPDRGTSILADRDQGRPLEWDIRNGVVQRRGRALGIPTPISDVLVPLLAATSDGPG
ncbi:oxidoreductase [Cellulomonas sp. RIT-PI-Y]|uniref:oxidoreductase n=1 Tax=Cellulomonas sp. RIT-PI-Y TaxID=3035297 RepID=UPI0021DABD29|nr:oxidoreductase [Cellulomonas sp. RIT-PI-Y]